MFNLTSEELKKQEATYTANEIHQQPDVWQELVSTIFQQKESSRGFIESIYRKHDNTRVILTGAGTSAFIGDILVPELRKQTNGKVQFEAIPTTDIVSNPNEYLLKDVPTIMVSFARSGNSPESIAAVTLGEQFIDNFYQVVITCNKDGELAKNIKNDDNAITILTPDKAHDKGFAMTSSFTCMIITAYTLFTPNAFTGNKAKQIIANGERLVDSVADHIDDILQFDFHRLVYLGSGLLGQLSHEASLKMLELSAGKVAATYESSLGFRHGPKSILDERSVVVLFMSQDAYTRKYDMDILRELAADKSEMKVIALTEKKDQEVEELADWTITVNDSQASFTSDFQLALLYIIFAQVLALKKSIQLGITPDNPSPDGRVNRVVQGVTIYEYDQ
ncbi:SIS domain-containing protein [Virgibacillus dakarensis]|uniref:SIS domain-containing protein n=1 Tax=Virgibacillus dakarensis TaxID=1917889 RepID=UPI000B452829|nr:SIS domain-containing protein [Virgibacillus dakarensis]MBT2215988.1 SIS domain-containing protein [Virgibacillus dakarensis]MTW84410.1 SIS domain-containing protein [Virgibacillus dakarensis]